MTEILKSMIAAIGIDIGKNSFHVVGLDGRGAVALRQKWSRGQVEARLANMPACLIGMKACVGAWPFSEVPLSATEGRSRLQSGLRQAARGSIYELTSYIGGSAALQPDVDRLVARLYTEVFSGRYSR